MESVQVALRIRPLLESEITMGCQQCIERIPNEPQVKVGKANNCFTYDYVFDEFEGQSKVYNVSIKQLIEKLFQGYNLTILAYGQTGSGKTFTMGTNYSGSGEMGVIPRAVYEIFDAIKVKENYTFKVTVSFLELYNESIYDLLTSKTRECSVVDMREVNNEICIPGLTQLEVTDPLMTLQKLNEGSLGRMVGATAMNAQSSRSHAVFTLNIRITPKDNKSGVMTSSFRLVDLAGSERSKKTCTTGDRFKEGININKGLLVLGNVISQLGEGNQNFISYRDSKLTRLLQDSLGGNSLTLMIACVSPADYNQDETMSTLRYADRVKKIKNKPIVNQDPQTAEIGRLKKEIEELRLKIIHNTDCPPSHKVLQNELDEVRNKLKLFNGALTETLWSNAKMYEKAVMVEQFDENIKEKLKELNNLTYSINTSQNNKSNNFDILNEVSSKIKQVQTEYNKAGKELLKHEVECEQETDSKDAGEPSPTRQEYILTQAKINREIFVLTQNLMWKEELISTYENSNDNADVQGATQMVNELQKQITELQHEKEELMHQLSSSTASSKIAEQRRKRLQELEAKVSVLTKKISDQERIIKMRVNAEEKIKNLKNDIMEMKKMKVRLILQMKMGHDKFQLWKTAKNKEMIALKHQNIKNQNELKKMELIHNRQQNVLKRKLEAAAAANKRLVAVLDRQKTAKLRNKKGSTMNIIKEKIHEEVEMLESTCHAQHSLESLIQDRAQLTRNLSDVKVRLGKADTSEQEENKLSMEKKQLEEELALRNTEIADLQQKLLDVHDDLTSKEWDVLESLGDAKYTVNYLYTLLNDKIKENISKEHLLTELLEQYNESEQEVNKLKQQLQNMKDSNKSTEWKTERDADTKRKGRRNERDQFEVADEESLKAFDDSLEIDCDNLDNDPDWTKTPLYKKLQSLKAKRQQGNLKCGCTGTCNKKCSKKGKHICNDKCTCDLSASDTSKNVSVEIEENNVSTCNKRPSKLFPDLLGDIQSKKKKIYFEEP